MIKNELLAIVKAYRAGADALERYIKELTEKGFNWNKVSNPEAVSDIAMDVAEKSIQETLDCELKKEQEQSSH